MTKNEFCVIAFDQIKIQASKTSQNVGLSPIFVKDINVVGGKKARNGHKMANSWGCLFFCAIVYITLEKFKFKMENIIVIQKPTGKIRKELTFFTGFMLSILNLYLTKEFKFVS